MKEKVLESLSTFTRSSLEDAARVSFLHRFDTKYVFKAEEIFDFLKNIEPHYSVLQVEGHVIQDYNTVYFDTPDLLCFNMHHNKRARRFKFRTRKYLSNGKIFNEIKQKLNTGKTIKFRQRRDEFNEKPPVLPVVTDLSVYDEHFEALLKTNGYNVGQLHPSLRVYFSRVTFLNKTFAERMTLDIGLSYGHNGQHLMLYNTVIVELKRERGPEKTAVQEYLRSIHKGPSGFSKYAIGIAMTHEDARRNRFLPRIRNLPYEMDRDKDVA